MALILMLDDEKDACQLVQRILSLSGHDVRAFTTAKEALGWLQDNKPELALLDLKLRGANAMSVLHYIRDHQPETRVVIITGNPSTETNRKVSELGIEDYLVKPIEIRELEDHVNRVLGLTL